MNRRILFISFALAALGIVGCASSSDLSDYPGIQEIQAAQGPVGANPIIEVGDRLEIYILEDESFNGIYQVRQGGHVIFPQVGRIEVAGLSLGEAELKIKTAFESDQLKQATIIIERHGVQKREGGANSVTVYLAGPGVTKKGPAQVPFLSGLRPTVYQAVIHAGGSTSFANLKGAYVIRRVGNTNQRIDVNLKHVGQGGGADMPIQTGDIIYIPERIFGF